MKQFVVTGGLIALGLLVFGLFALVVPSVVIPKLGVSHDLEVVLSIVSGFAGGWSAGLIWLLAWMERLA